MKVYLKKITAGNFPNLILYMNIKHPKNSKNSNLDELKKTQPRHIIIKLLKAKHKRKILKPRRKQLFIYKDYSIRISDFSLETLKARGQWNNIFKILKEKQLIEKLYPQNGPSKVTKEKLSFFSDKQKI